MSLGRPVLVVEQGGGVFQTTSGELGFPKGLYPNKVRLRDDLGNPTWFTFDSLSADRRKVFFKGGGKTLVVVFS